MAYSIVKILGIERIRARAPEWLAAMRAGRERAPRCGAPTRAKTPCALTRLTGADRCRHHLHGAARDAVDAARLLRAQKTLSRTTNAHHRARAETTIAAVQRRQLHRAWKLDPTLPGSTLALPDHDEARVRAWLRYFHRIDLDQGTHANTAHPITARAIDRLRWAATLFLSGRMDAERAARRVFVAVRDDLKYWAKRG
jgi:hypothetical protein